MSPAPPVLPVVWPGSFGKIPGAEGVTANGTPMVCALSADGRFHWKARDPAPATRTRLPRATRHTPATSPPPAGQEQPPLPLTAVITITPADNFAPLTDDDLRMLTFETRTWPTAGSKESDILREFRMSSARFYQRINYLIDHPRANDLHPLMCARLRRLRDSRRRCR